MKLETVSPVDNSIYYTIEAHTKTDIDAKIKKSEKAFKYWSKKSLEERILFIQKMINFIVKQENIICKEISWQMGRPYKQVSSEIFGFKERASYMISIAEKSLSSFYPDKIQNFERWITKEPLGLIAVLSPWNYPLLTSVNVIIPALIAGNVVILKHSTQTPLVAENYKKAAIEADFPEGVFDIVHLSHQDTSYFISEKAVQGVFFTGSVEGGKQMQQAVSNKFISCGLELGGKDPAYVRPDANIDWAAKDLVDGSFFNSGQSCCGVERIYVHKNIYENFLDKFIKITNQYSLGNPLLESTTLGPMVKTSSADFVREQIQQAISKGAKTLIDEKTFPNSQKHTPYLAPQILIQVDHNMRVMTEESFGPIVGIMKVENDEKAVEWMNDSKFGLTASIWSEDIERSKFLASEIEAGTVFLNRSDYIDPSLAWTGVKNSGRGITLSEWGYSHLTKAKSHHFRIKI